ncbi:MAG: hypothetical protein P8R54_22655 [Myxococcota bacterium]|nr:hypothetical protein [Myxococcota bacterium]
MDNLILAQLEEYLSQKGFKVHFQRSTAEVPVNQLVVALGEEAYLYMMKLPGLDKPPTLQLMIILPVQVPVSRFGHTARIICLVNSRLPLKGFELDEQNNGNLYFRHLLPLAGASWDADRILEVLHSMVTLLGRFGSPVLGVASGEMRFGEGRAAFLKSIKEHKSELNTA